MSRCHSCGRDLPCGLGVIHGAWQASGGSWGGRRGRHPGARGHFGQMSPFFRQMSPFFGPNVGLTGGWRFSGILAKCPRFLAKCRFDWGVAIQWHFGQMSPLFGQMSDLAGQGSFLAEPNMLFWPIVDVACPPPGVRVTDFWPIVEVD